MDRLFESIYNYLVERSEKKHPKEFDILSLNENELLLHYYDELIKLYNGSKVNAAKRADLNYRTFISRYNKMRNKKPTN